MLTLSPDPFNHTSCYLYSQILASFTNGSMPQLPNERQTTSKEINNRIEHAIKVRSSQRMHREHITDVTLVFKDTHIETKVRWNKEN